MEPFVDSRDLLANPEALCARFENDGYVYVSQLFPRHKLLALRRQIVAICAEEGWLKPGTEPMDAVTWTVPKVEGEEGYFRVYDRVQRLQDFHALAHEAEAITLMQALLGDTAFPHPLSIARLVFPDNQDWTTPPHQDYVNNQGTERLYACWIPLSDCPRALGSLEVMSGSHKLGLLPLEYSLGAGHRQAVLGPETRGLTWVGGDFALGDVIAFHSLTVHRSLPNTTDHMRISVDFRYQAERQAMTDNCRHPHFRRQTWEQIYQGWSRRDLMYYWRDKAVDIVPWNEELGRLPDGHIGEAIRRQRQFDRKRRTLEDKYRGEDRPPVGPA